MPEFSPELTSISAVIGLLVWLITRAFPQMWAEVKEISTSATNERKEMLGKFEEMQQAQRSDFRDELAKHREMSTGLARSGHEAVNNLSKQVEALRVARDETEPLA